MSRIRNIILGGIAFLMCYPSLYMIVGAFMGKNEVQEYLAPVLSSTNGYAGWSLLPRDPQIWSFIQVLIDSPEFYVVFWNSVEIVCATILGQLLLAVPAAWGFSRYNFYGKKYMFSVYIILMLLPFQTLMLSEYLVLNRLNLLNTSLAIILPGIFSTLQVFMMYYFFLHIPESIIESARIDGAKEKEIFWYIGLPLGKSGIIAILILGFLEYWNLVEQPMTFIRDKTKWPLSIYFTDIQLEDVGVVFVSIVIALIPSVFAFYFGYEYIEEGIVASAIRE